MLHGVLPLPPTFVEHRVREYRVSVKSDTQSIGRRLCSQLGIPMGDVHIFDGSMPTTCRVNQALQTTDDPAGTERYDKV